jgi:mRNA interferase RelE/StbE
MKRFYKPSFLRCIKKINDPALRKEIEKAVLSVKWASSPKDIPGLKKMSGHKNFFRIRVGNYRIGIAIDGDAVTFYAFGLRKDVYRGFPPR